MHKIEVAVSDIMYDIVCFMRVYIVCRYLGVHKVFKCPQCPQGLMIRCLKCPYSIYIRFPRCLIQGALGVCSA